MDTLHMGATFLIFVIALVLDAISKQPKAERGRSIFIVVAVCVVAVIAMVAIDSANSGKSDAHSPSTTSTERSEKFYSSGAREEMREFLKTHGHNPNPSEADISYGLKVNERLEYHIQREKIHPEEYK